MTRVTEAVGVPDNIYEISGMILDGIMDRFEVSGNILNFKVNNDGGTLTRDIEFVFPINSRLGVIDITDAVVRLQLSKVIFNDSSEKDKFTVLKAHQFTALSRDIPKQRLNAKKEGIIKIGFLIGYSDNPINIESLTDFLRTEKKYFIRVISHEIMHMYDNMKSGSKSMLDVSKYRAYTGTNFPIRAVEVFLWYLYYTTATENVVMMSEVYADIRTERITKDEFYDFVTKNEVYSNLREIGEYSLEKFREEIKKEMSEVDKLLYDVLPGDPPESDDEKVDEILRILYVNITNNQLDEYIEFMTSDFESIFGITSKDKIKILRGVTRKAMKYENNIVGYYRDVEKRFKTISNKYMRRISKLYYLSVNSKDTLRSKEYKLHNTINKRGSVSESVIITNFRYFIKSLE